MIMNYSFLLPTIIIFVVTTIKFISRWTLLVVNWYNNNNIIFLLFHVRDTGFPLETVKQIVVL